MQIIYMVLFLAFTAFSQVNIVTTIKPIADISKAVCKDKCNISYIIPPNASMHNYAYKISDIKKIYNADIFIFIGPGEPQIDNIIKSIPDKNLLHIADIKGINLIKNFEFKKIHKEKPSGKIFHHHENFHPAVWLDPINAKHIANAVFKKLAFVDKQNTSFYKENLERFSKKIDNLLKYGYEKLGKLKNKNFISYHYTYPYFTKRFKLNYLAVIEMGHGREPSTKHLIKIINLIKQKNIKSIFATKQFYNSKYGNLVKTQTGVKIIFLDPFGKNKDYIQTIKEIINKIYQG